MSNQKDYKKIAEIIKGRLSSCDMLGMATTGLIGLARDLADYFERVEKNRRERFYKKYNINSEERFNRKQFLKDCQGIESNTKENIKKAEKMKDCGVENDES